MSDRKERLCHPCRIDQHVEMTCLEDLYGPPCTASSLGGAAVARAELDIAARRIRPAGDDWQRLFEKVEGARLELGEQSRSCAIVRDLITQVLIGPFRKSAASDQLKLEFLGQLRHARSQLLQPGLPWMRQTRIHEDVASNLVWRRRANGGQKRSGSTMADEDQWSVLWHGRELAPNRLHLLSPVGNVCALVIAHQGGNNCLSAALSEALGDT